MTPEAFEQTIGVSICLCCFTLGLTLSLYILYLLWLCILLSFVIVWYFKKCCFDVAAWAYIHLNSEFSGQSQLHHILQTAYNRQLSGGHFSQIYSYMVSQTPHIIFFYNNLTVVLTSHHEISTYKIIFYSFTIWRSERRMGTVTQKIYDRASYSADFSHLVTHHQ